MRDRQVPDQGRIIARLESRISVLERRLSKVIDERRLPGLFSFSGLLELGPSPAWKPVWPVEIALIVPNVETVGTSDVIIDLKRDGAVVRTLTIPAGENYIEDAAPFIIPQSSKLVAEITQTGAAEELSISLVPRLL